MYLIFGFIIPVTAASKPSAALTQAESEKKVLSLCVLQPRMSGAKQAATLDAAQNLSRLGY